MNHAYQDKYYDHFTRKISAQPPAFEKDTNYMMRFNAPMKSYAYTNNNLVIIYFKKGHGSIEWCDKRQVVNDDSFIITNPSDGWEFLNKNEGIIDVLSLVLSEKLQQEFNTYQSLSRNALLDNPFYLSNNEFRFIENAFNAQHYPSGQILKNIYNSSLKQEFELLDAEELTLLAVDALHKDQTRAYKYADHIVAKKQTTKLETLKRLLVAREYIHDNLDRKITIDELAKVTCLSKFHLYDSFKAVYRKTPHQYTNNIKILKAKELLTNNRHSVSEVSTLVGFNDIHSFSKIFKKKCGVAPTTFVSKKKEGLLF